jgi:Na+/melibiose symporter-like transporter
METHDAQFCDEQAWLGFKLFVALLIFYALFWCALELYERIKDEWKERKEKRRAGSR